jgi:transposase
MNECCPIPFDVPGFTISQIKPSASHLSLGLKPMQQEASCPVCGHHSRRQHSGYTRRVQDVPMGTRMVELHIEVRRFRCLNPICPRTTFAEQHPALMLRRARRTNRLNTHLTQVGLALGGEEGAWLAKQLLMPTSGDTLLRLLRQVAVPAIEPPRVIGIDDWAFRKGRTYGTLIVDLERQRPIDLLPTRDSAAVKEWLLRYPTVEIITRDRSGEYREAATAGAPQAIQVADRWHLLHNLREAVERHVTRRYRSLRQTLVSPSADNAANTSHHVPADKRRRYAPESGRVEQQAARQAQREELYRTMKEMQAKGVYATEIAKALNLCRQTVSRWLETDHLPPDSRGRFKQVCLIDAFVPYLKRRLAEGCTNKSKLWREVKAQGFTGDRTLVGKWVRQNAEGIATKRDQSDVSMPLPKQLVWSLLQNEEQWTAEERQLWQWLRQDSALAEVRRFATDFVAMVCQRQAECWPAWLEAAVACSVKEVRNFALNLKQDEAAVQQALKQSWSNGPVEGHVNRLKLVKRKMYGRANFDLLRLRVLCRVS